MKIKKIANIPITRSRPFLILEAGVNHEGSISTAFEMIDAAAETGADMIKFQSYKAETLASRNSPSYWDTSKEKAKSQYELFKKHDSFGDAEYKLLAERCKQKGILFASTPFDLHFIDFLEGLMPVYKIASADLTNYPFLKKIAAKKKPILLSTGASLLSEIDDALRVIKDAGGTEIALLHCVLEYPTKAEHANLETIPYLQSVYPDITIGWSDHIPPQNGCMSMLAAWIQGADILEKHYTLDKTLSGNDHYHAMDPDDVREFFETQQYYFNMLGQKTKDILSCEKEARKFARRSIVAACNIPKGTKITDDMLTVKRPGTGISPKYWDIIIGRKALSDIKEDEILEWDKI